MASEPKPAGVIGKAPRFFDAAQKAAWKEIVTNAPPDVLTCTDRVIVERVARLIAKMRDNTLSTAEGSQLLSGLGRLGMTPVDRARLSVTPRKEQKPENTFASFLNDPILPNGMSQVRQ
jgi:hypothetical protein